MEKNYSEYIQMVDHLVSDDHIRQTMRSLKTLGKFQLSEDGTWNPVNYEGLTFITPTPNEDNENQGVYRRLLYVKARLAETINPSKVVQAPDSALHMTVARLVSGEVFEERIMGVREEDFLESMRQLLRNIPVSYGPEFEIKGITVFPQGVLAAVLSPVHEADYSTLQTLRDRIYSDTVMKTFGVERRRGFKGHISLFYIENELSETEKQRLTNAIIEVNTNLFGTPTPFHIKRVEVRSFVNFFGFFRKENWPVLQLL